MVWLSAIPGASDSDDQLAPYGYSGCRTYRHSGCPSPCWGGAGDTCAGFNGSGVVCELIFYLKYVKRIASLYKELELKIDDERKQKKSLVVGVSHTSESNAIAEVLATYCAKNKGTRIKIISSTIKNLYDKLQSYEIDLAIVEGVIPSKKYNSLLLDTDSLVAVLANENHLANNKIININDLKNENLILRSTNSQTTTLFESSLNNVNLSLNDFNVILELDNIATIKDLVSHNRGISILPKSACYHEIKNNTLQIRPIANFNMSRQINIIFPKNFEYEYILNDIVSIYNNLVH